MISYKLDAFGNANKTVAGEVVANVLLHHPEYLAWLEAGNTPEPYAAPVPTPIDQISAKEDAKPITHRMLRDLSMTVAQIAAAVTGTDMMTNPAVRDILALEAEITTLRDQARADGLIP